MKRIDFTNLGGLPFSQNRANYMQQTYTEALGAIAKLCGDKVILTGVEVSGGSVTDGWIAYGGELIFFQGGTTSTDVVISETPTPFVFGDNTTHDVYFTKIATCGPVGAFPFADLVPLLSLQNMWMPGDVKEKYCDAAYIAANFDGSGYGLNADKGWRIMAFALPDSAGKTFINYDPADGDYDEPGKFGGTKTKTLAGNEQGTFTVASKTDDLINAVGGGANAAVRIRFNGSIEPADGAANAAAFGANLTVALSAAANAHNVMNPYFVILKLIKL